MEPPAAQRTELTDGKEETASAGEPLQHTFPVDRAQNVFKTVYSVRIKISKLASKQGKEQAQFSIKIFGSSGCTAAIQLSQIISIDSVNTAAPLLYTTSGVDVGKINRLYVQLDGKVAMKLDWIEIQSDINSLTRFPVDGIIGYGKSATKGFDLISELTVKQLKKAESVYEIRINASTDFPLVDTGLFVNLFNSDYDSTGMVYVGLLNPDDEMIENMSKLRAFPMYNIERIGMIERIELTADPLMKLLCIHIDEIDVIDKESKDVFRFPVERWIGQLKADSKSTLVLERGILPGYEYRSVIPAILTERAGIAYWPFTDHLPKILYASGSNWNL